MDQQTRKTGSLAVLISGIYIGIYRWVYPGLPAWLRTETVKLTWKNLRLPGLLATISAILGLVMIT